MSSWLSCCGSGSSAGHASLLLSSFHSDKAQTPLCRGLSSSAAEMQGEGIAASIGRGEENRCVAWGQCVECFAKALGWGGELKLAPHCSSTEHTAVLGLCSSCCSRGRAEEGKPCWDVWGEGWGLFTAAGSVWAWSLHLLQASHFQDCCRQKRQQDGNVLLFEAHSPPRQVLVSSQTCAGFHPGRKRIERNYIFQKIARRSCSPETHFCLLQQYAYLLDLPWTQHKPWSFSPTILFVFSITCLQRGKSMGNLNFPSPISFWVLCPIVQKFWSQLIQILGESDFVSWASSCGQDQNRVLKQVSFCFASLISDFQLKTVIQSATLLWLEHILAANERGWRFRLNNCLHPRSKKPEVYYFEVCS